MSNSAVFTMSGFTSMLARGFSAATVSRVPTVFAIGLSSVTALVTDTDLGEKVSAWSSGSDFKAYVSGYPIFKETDQMVTVQGFVASTEANGNTITEYGDFDTQFIPGLASHVIFTGITKVSSVQIYITTTFSRET